MGPWAPSPEAGGWALILGFTWRMAKLTLLPRIRQLVGPDTRVLLVDGAAGSGWVGGRPGLAFHLLSQACTAPRPPSGGGSGTAADGGGRGRAHFCWGCSSPHRGPLHTLLCGLHLSWDAGEVGRSPRLPHHPCGFPAFCPHVRPQPLGCPHLDMPSVSSWGQISSPDGHGVDAVSLSLRWTVWPRQPGNPRPGGAGGSLAGPQEEGLLWALSCPRPPSLGRASGPALQGTRWAHYSQW